MKSLNLSCLQVMGCGMWYPMRLACSSSSSFLYLHFHLMLQSSFLAICSLYGDEFLECRHLGNSWLLPWFISCAFLVWVDVITNLFIHAPYQDAVSLARTEEEPEAAARKLTEVAFTRGSADNITCIVVRFHHEKAVSASSSPQHED